MWGGPKNAEAPLTAANQANQGSIASRPRWWRWRARVLVVAPNQNLALQVKKRLANDASQECAKKVSAAMPPRRPSWSSPPAISTMLALSCLTVGLVPHAALRTQSLLQAQPLRVARRAPPPQAHAAAIFESSHLATTVQLGMDATVVSDTLLDVGVYGLLALTVGLTLYSVFVTLDEANNKAGGCVDNPRGSLLYVRGTRASLLRAVRTRGAGQLAPGPRARSVRRTRTGLWRAVTYD